MPIVVVSTIHGTGSIYSLFQLQRGLKPSKINFCFFSARSSDFKFIIIVFFKYLVELR